ncbi:LppP/LprE family lipoprotein [Nocardia sp. NPDC050717]|uniref:LppP/LprE family lipoprotein n=1 Tax=Nocardia sp. NPDC050717 TaxID=3157221 RepID=UPI0033D2CD50
MKNVVRMSALIVAAAAAVAGCTGDGGSTGSAPTSAKTAVTTPAPTGGAQPTGGQGATGGQDSSGGQGSTGGQGSSGGQNGGATPDTTQVSQPPAGDDISGPGKCIDITSTGVRNALARLGDGWHAQRGSNDIPGQCADLLWVQAVGGNSAGAPIHVLFFHDGQWLGTATSEPYAFTSVVGYTTNVVTVEYKWLAGDEPFATPQGGPVAIHYTWNGSNVVMSGPLPREVTQPQR